ncbi:MAG: hypothetical protein K2M12_05355 [Muribaculaceae bacterium]|nr:hypothetical protein [Muribaculaceae bacterium]
MKKLLLTLLLLFALGSSGAWAATQPAYTCLFGADYNSEQISSYTETWSVTCDGNKWNIANFNNNKNGWAYVKCGNRTDASVAYIATDFVVPEVISEVVVTIDAITASSVNSIKLCSSATADFADANTNKILGPTPAKGEYKITVPEDKQNANLYYRVEFDCKKGSSNGLVQVSKVVLKTPVDPITATTGEIFYKAGVTNKVFKGTEVKFAITDYESSEFTVSATETIGETTNQITFEGNGTYTTTINEAVTYNITVKNDDATNSATFVFEPVEQFTAEGWRWQRVENVSTLQPDDKLIIASGEFAMSNVDNGANNISDIKVGIGTEDGLTVLNFTQDPASEIFPLTLELLQSEIDNTIPWTLHTTNYSGTNGYLSATSDSEHLLEIVENEDDLTIEINDGTAFIDFNGHTHHILGYNKDKKVFACYPLDAVVGSEGDDKYRTDEIQLYRYTNKDADPRVVLSAKTNDGKTIYSPFTTYDVAKGTVVTFAVKNYTGATIQVGEEAAQTLGDSKEVTINDDVTVVLTAGEESSATYTFKVRDTFEISKGNYVVYYSVADALEAIAAGVTPTVNVKGVITEVVTFNDEDQSLTYRIGDENGENVITILNGKYIDNDLFEGENDLAVGSDVIVYGQLYNEGETASMAAHSSVVFYDAHVPTLTVTSGERESLVNYYAGTYKVKQGAEVSFAVNYWQNAEFSASIKVEVGEAEELVFTEGICTIAIEKETTVTISGLTEQPETYVFIPILPLTPDGYQWVLVEDASTLAAGDKLIVANAQQKVAMSNEYSINNRPATKENEIDIASGILSFDEYAMEYAPLIVELKESGKVDAPWCLYTNNYKDKNNVDANNYLGAPSSSSNYLKVASTQDSLTIGITNGNALIKFTGNKSRNILRYNNSSNLFSCYSSGQNDVQLYRLTNLNALTVTATVGNKGYSASRKNYVDKGTEVTFTVTNGEAISATINDAEVENITDGCFSEKIEVYTEVVITANDETFTFIFEVHPTFELADGTTVNCMFVEEAIAAIEEGSTEKVYVKGVIDSVESYNDTYHSLTYYIKDADSEGQTKLQVYSGKGLNSADFNSTDDLSKGAEVVVYGELKIYNNTPELNLNNYLVYYFDPAAATPVTITATTGDVTYVACDNDNTEINTVSKGTVVTFTSENLTNEVFTVKVNENDPVTVEGNSYNVTIEGETTVELTVGEGESKVAAEYWFDVPEIITYENHSWVRVNSPAALVANEMVIIVGDKYTAMGNKLINDGKAAGVDVDIDENLLSFEEQLLDAPMVFKLVAGGTAEAPTWAFEAQNYKGVNGYLTATAENGLEIVESKEDAVVKIEKGTATISFDGTDVIYGFGNTFGGGEGTVQIYRMTNLPHYHEGTLDIRPNNTPIPNAVKLEFTFNVINHNGGEEKHELVVYGEDNKEIKDVEIRDNNTARNSSSRAAGDKNNIATVNGSYSIIVPSDATLSKVTLKSYIGDVHVLSATVNGDGTGVKTGIEDVTVDGEGAGAVEYYNLQGVRVSHPAAGQLYIKREGNRTSKIRF